MIPCGEGGAVLGNAASPAILLNNHTAIYRDICAIISSIGTGLMVVLAGT